MPRVKFKGLITLIYRSLKGTVMVRETECRVCSKMSKLTANSIKICIDCLRERSKEALFYLREAHAKIRSHFGLPAHPPKRSKKPWV